MTHELDGGLLPTTGSSPSDSGPAPRSGTWAIPGWVVKSAPWIVTIVVLLVVWQWWIAPRVSPVLLKPPSDVFEKLRDWFDDGRIQSATLSTVWASVLGLGAGVALAVGAALVVSWSALIGHFFEPFVAMLYATPRIALLPVLFIWFSNPNIPRLVYVVLLVFPIMFLSLMTGLRSLEGSMTQALQLMGATRRQIAFKLQLPAVIGYVLAGLSIVGPLAFSSAIVVEMLQERGGLGALVADASLRYDAAGVLAGTVVATVLGLVAIRAVRAMTRHVLWAVDR